MSEILVLPGLCGFDVASLHEAAAGFGWVVRVARDLDQAVAGQACERPVAVLFRRDAICADCSWLEALRRLQAAMPGVRAIACPGFAEPIDWEQMSDAGAFHSLWLPLSENEVRKSLGFVWEAENRRADFAVEEAMPGTVPSGTLMSKPTRLRRISGDRVHRFAPVAFRSPAR